MVKPRLRVSISGGRTSAYMSAMIKQYLSDQYELLFLFANTSCEDPRTLRFLNDVDRHFNLGIVWLEAEVHYDARKSCGHRVVTYETAKRNGEVFDAVVQKYGLPNKTFKLCTRELKTNPMASYARSVGWTLGSYETAIGIRMDEMRRVNATVAAAERIIYPLIDWFPTDKSDVLAYFEQFDWDLDIEEHEGNCVWCYKKSDKKLHRLSVERPEVFEFPMRLDDLYRNVGPNNVPGPRKMFRGYRDTRALLASFSDAEVRPLSQMEGSCSESCEVYETEESAEEEILW